MAKFKKGWKGGPGRPPHTIVTKLLYKKREEMATRLLELLEMGKDELKRMKALEEGISGYDSMLAKAILNARSIVDVRVLLETVFGPQKTPVEVTGANGTSLFPKDPELTGQRLTDSIRLAKALLAARAAGKLPIPTTEKTVSG